MKKIFTLLFCALTVAFVSCKDDKTENADFRFDTPVLSDVSATAATVTCKVLSTGSIGSIPVMFAYGDENVSLQEYAIVANPIVSGNTFSCRLTDLSPRTNYRVVALLNVGDTRYSSAPTPFITTEIGPGETVLEITSLTTIPVVAEADVYTITYHVINPKSDAQAEASCPSAWVHAFDYSSSDEISFDVDANTGAERNAVITIAYPGATSRQVTVVQRAAAVTPPANPQFITPSYSNLTENSVTIACSYTYAGSKTVTDAYFVYAAPTGGDQRANIAPIQPGDKNAVLTGLTSATRYTFRLCVVIDGTTYSSASATFTTTGSSVDPGPGLTKYSGWAELPVEVANNDFYYAYHLCPDYKINNRAARNFTVCYSAEHHCPVWVAAPLHNCYVGDEGNRSYGPDQVIPRNIQPSSKTVDSPYNKGHMLGNRERSGTSGMNKQVSYYTNMAPQQGQTFNTGGGAWNNLEDYIDGHWCNDTLYMVSGCRFETWTDSYGNTASPKRVGFGGVKASVPTMFYYVLLRTKSGNSGKSVMQCSASELKTIGFVMSHAMPKGHKPERRDIRSVEEIETMAGFKFFTNVPNVPKGTPNPAEWGL